MKEMKERMKCGFCGGSGEHPYSLLPNRAKCQVCWGKGQVDVKTPHVDCRYCLATGHHPGTRLTCSACLGKGSRHVPEKRQECPRCQGTGRWFRYPSRFYCQMCGGAGLVAA